MDFHLTPERETYINSRGKIILNACPGSGKTTCIVHKLAILQKECFTKHNSYAGVACLSFTNVAKHEILSKYKKAFNEELRYPHTVSTIDSFINHYITLPFYNLLNKTFLSRPKIVDQAHIIDKAFTVYFQQDGELKATITPPLNKFKTKQNAPLYRSYPPSSIWITPTGQFTFKGTNPSASNVDPNDFFEYAKGVFQSRGKKGLITSGDSSFMALHLLTTYPKIAEYLVKRFPYVIIDEAQDNSEIQHLIFEKLVKAGLENIELVGDPYQSLYEWKDAKPELFTAKYSDPGWTGLPLSQNRRSVQRIIDCFEIVKDPNDIRVTSIAVSDQNIPIHIYKISGTNIENIIYDFGDKCKAFNFQRNQIVVRGKSLRDKLLGHSSDINPWKSHIPSALIAIRYQFETNEVKEAVDNLRKLITELQNPTLDYGMLQDLVTNLKEDYNLNGKLYDFLYKLPKSNISFQEWSTQTIDIIQNEFGVDATEHFIFKKRMDGFRMTDLVKENVDTYFSRSGKNQYGIPITTIHQVKGVTLNAILYIMDDTSHGEKVAFRDFKPSAGFPDEKQRLIYVACSRPEQFLAIALPDSITDEELVETFGEKIVIVTVAS